MNPEQTAAIAAKMIKPLEWSKGIVDYARPMTGMKYIACSQHPQTEWCWWLDGEVGHQICANEEAAKAAAQADYAARMIAGMDIAVLAGLVEALRGVAEWDKSLEYLIPYRVRNPIIVALVNAGVQV